MDSLTIIITLVSLVAGVLQIILFFKVWGMCNDVRIMRQQQCKENSSNEDDNGYGRLLIWFVGTIIFVVILIILAAYN